MLRAKLKNLIASLCKSNFMLPTSMVLAAVWLLVNHSTSEPSKIAAKDSREKSMAAGSLQVVLSKLVTHAILIKGNN